MYFRAHSNGRWSEFHLPKYETFLLWGNRLRLPKKKFPNSNENKGKICIGKAVEFKKKRNRNSLHPSCKRALNLHYQPNMVDVAVRNQPSWGCWHSIHTAITWWLLHVTKEVMTIASHAPTSAASGFFHTTCGWYNAWCRRW